jgi:hypothetical protein
MSKKQITESYRDNMSNAQLTRYEKSFKCSNGTEFKNITTAVNWLKSIGFKKAARAGIKRCLSGKPTATAYGFGWKYANS